MLHPHRRFVLPSTLSSSQSPPSPLMPRLHAMLAANGNWLSFERYMELALYEPEFGYYRTDTTKIGAAGDFITAPESGNLFATCMAVQCAEILARCASGPRVIIEFGPGNGRLAADILEVLAAQEALPERYLLVETSPAMVRRQQALLTARGWHGDRVQWVQQVPKTITGVVIANELLDALPAVRFEVGDHGALLELGVSRAPNGGLCWRPGEAGFAPPTARDLAARLGDITGIVGYRSEAGLQAEAWVRDLAGRVDTGAMLIVDYGFPAHEYYHPERNDGTLMCHHRHTAHPDPLARPGLDDMTCHIDFSAIAGAGTAAGMTVAGYCTQARFLLSLGLLDRYRAVFAEREPNAESLALAAQIKKLTLPHEMGELFKVMALARNIDPQLAGFSMQNIAARL